MILKMVTTAMTQSTLKDEPVAIEATGSIEAPVPANPGSPLPAEESFQERFRKRSWFVNSPMIRMFNVYYPTRTVLLLLCEMVLVSSCFLVATGIVLGRDADIALYYEHGLLKIFGITIMAVLLSYYFDLYEPQIISSSTDIYFRLLLVLGCSCFLLSAVLWFFPEMAIAPAVYAIGFGLLAPSLLAWRQFHKRMASKSFLAERVYVLGAGRQAQTIVETIESRPDIGMQVVGWQSLDLSQEDRRVIWVRDLNALAKARTAIDRIIIAMEDARNELPMQELLNLRFQGVLIEVAAALRERLSGKIQLEGLRPSNLLYGEGFRVRPSQQFTRVVLSTCAAVLGLLLFLPFFPFVALLVKLSSSGPVFFRQTRVGLNGKLFQVVKFRTMRTDAEAGGAKWATKNDPRVTRVGSFLRKTRIDELPQLWNVVRGDMTFVGPRPERPEFVSWLNDEIPFYYLRHLIRPGLTGWSQIRYGYGATLAETREKLEYDLYYVKHMSLGLDLLIMFETIKTIVRRRGAQ